MTVFSLVKQEDKKEPLKISYLSPFKFTDFILLVLSAGFKVAASRTNYDLNALLSDLAGRQETIADKIRFENEFFIGICVGTVISAVFFMLVFKKKIYLLIVFFNSIQIIFETIKIVFFFIDEQIDKSTGGEISL